MLLCGGDQVLFGLYSLAIILLLIGGCIWGQGTDSNDSSKYTGGLIVFITGGCLFIFAILVNIYKRIKKARKRRKLAKTLTIEKPILIDKPILIEKPKQQIKNQENLKSIPKISLENDKYYQQNQYVKTSNPFYLQNGKPNINSQSSNSNTNITNKSNAPIIPISNNNNNTTIYKNISRSQAAYLNPGFEPEMKTFQNLQSPISKNVLHIPTKNAAKNYSRSLYNAHAAGKI